MKSTYKATDAQIWIGKGDLQFHCALAGSTGKGISTNVAALARQAGVSYAEMERRSQPSAERQQEQAAEKAMLDIADHHRLQMVRNAFWAGASPDEFNGIHDAIVSLLGIEPSTEQIQAVFNLLPKSVIAGAIQWGMNDTEVRDETYLFIQANEASVRQSLWLQHR